MRLASAAPLLIAAMAAGTAAPAGAGAQQRQDLSATFTSATPGTPTGLEETIDYFDPADPAAKPPAVQRVVLRFHPGTRIDTSVPERCTASDAELIARGPAACPARSRVGTGELDVDTGQAAGTVPRVIETRVTFLNDDGAIILHVQSTNSTPQITLVSRGEVQSDAFVTQVPPLPGVSSSDPFLAIKRVRFDLDRIVANGRGYITTPPECPTGGSWTNRGTFTYRDGVTQVAEAASSCARTSGEGAAPAPPRLRLRGVPRRRCARRGFRLRVSVRAAAGIEATTVHLDGRRIDRSSRRRFSVPVRARRLRPGRHRLVVRAVDREGTGAVARARFTRCRALRLTG